MACTRACVLLVSEMKTVQPRREGVGQAGEGSAACGGGASLGSLAATPAAMEAAAGGDREAIVGGVTRAGCKRARARTRRVAMSSSLLSSSAAAARDLRDERLSSPQSASAARAPGAAARDRSPRAAPSRDTAPPGASCPRRTRAPRGARRSTRSRGPRGGSAGRGRPCRGAPREGTSPRRAAPRRDASRRRRSPCRRGR